MGAASNSVINDYIAGALSGAAGLIVGHPFDTTKVQLQTQQGASHYKGTWDAIKNINTHGWSKGFFRGLGFPLVSYGVVNSVFFGVYGNTLSYLGGSRHSPSNFHIFVSGCVAGAVQLVVACPVDVVKVVLQSQISHRGAGVSTVPLRGGVFYSGPMQCLRELLRHAGLRACYTGLGIQAARDLPASAAYFLIYVRLSEQLRAMPFSAYDPHGVVADLAAGGTAGVLSWALIMPLDVVKSKVQAEFGKGLRVLDCFRRTYAEGGLRAFYAGLGVNSIRAFCTNAVIFAVYSQCMKMISAVQGGGALVEGVSI